MRWKVKALCLYAVMVVALVSCAQLGITTDTPEKRLAVGYVTATSVNQAAVALGKQGKLSSADAQHVLDSTRAATRGLDVARDLLKADPKAADAKLQAQMVILKALEDYLALKGGK